MLLQLRDSSTKDNDDALTLIVHELEYEGCPGSIGEPSGRVWMLQKAIGLGSDSEYIVG